MGAPVIQKRIKPKYSPVMTAAEKRHKARVKELPCIGCGRPGPSDAHHTLLPVEGKRWRRDHEFLVPVCHECHQGDDGIHGIGNELTWCERMGVDSGAEAARLRDQSIDEGIFA